LSVLKCRGAILNAFKRLTQLTSVSETKTRPEARMSFGTHNVELLVLRHQVAVLRR
jgi:hypothetical protein